MRIRCDAACGHSSCSFRSSIQPLPGCEPRPDVRRQVLENLIAKYPREMEPSRRLIQVTEHEDTDNFPALMALELAAINSPGTKLRDRKKAAEGIAVFFDACPSSTDANAQRRLDRWTLESARIQ